MATLKITRISTILGCALLVIMALFHGSGINYISDLMQQSDAEPFLKEIFPVLFAHPSLQLFGLAGLGIVTLFMKQEIGKILCFIAIMVCVDSLLAFSLGAIIPGILLIIASLLFVLGAIKHLR
ncbi:hypothetical protein [Ulvibacterium sp.]|uniref:hypothetical protein n=1 Tax=Ulvibacterium sp. TaxID=2665914 RepID=UPI00263A21DE|nr:hypothetical protein [Ulvibacterium sp.]